MENQDIIDHLNEGEDDLTFDFDLDDEFSLEDDPFNPKPIVDDRKPVIKALDSFAESFTSQLKNPATINNILDKALPNKVLGAKSFVEDTYSSATNMYDKSVEALKEPLNDLKKEASRAKKLIQDFLPKGINDFLDRNLKTEETYDGGRYGYTDKEIKENQISSILAETFRMNQEQLAKESYKTELRDISSLEQGDLQSRLLDIIQQNTTRLVSVSEDIGVNYQRKSLEFQIRTFHVQQSIYEELSSRGREQLEVLNNILKNTALPDFVKIQNREIMAEMSTRRLIEMGQNAIGNKLTEYTGKLGENISNKVSNVVDGIVSGLSNAKQMLSLGNMMSEQMSSMNDSAFDFGPEIIESEQDKKLKSRAKSLGFLSTDYIAGFIANKVKKLYEKNPKVREYSERINHITENKEIYLDKLLGGGLEDILNKWTTKENGEQNVMLSSLISNVGSLLKEIKPSLSEDAGRKVNYNNIENLNQLAEFDNRFHKSVTDIIPGYLSRILASIDGIRTGQEQSLTLFSHSKDTFVSQERLQEDILNDLYKDEVKIPLESSIKSAITQLIGDNVTQDVADYLKKELVTDLRSGKFTELKDYLSTDYLDKDNENREIRERIQKLVQINSTTDNWSGELLDEVGKIKKESNFLSSLSNLYKRLPKVNELIHTKGGTGGVQYTDVLNQMGLTQDHVVNADVFYEQLLNNIDPFNLNKLKNENHNFNKRDLRESEETVTGSISSTPVRMSDSNMAYDSDKFESIITRYFDVATNQTEMLKVLPDNLSEILQEKRINNQMTNSILTESLRTNDILLELLEEVTNIKSSGINVIQSTTESSSTTDDKRKQSGVSGFLRRTYSDISKGVKYTKDKVGGVLKHGYESAKDKVSRTLDVIGKATKFTLSGVASFGKGALSAISYKKDKLTKDLYIRTHNGLKVALTYAKMLEGEYTDLSTGKVITSWDEIVGAVSDRAGNILVTAEDLRDGFFDRLGNKLDFSTSFGLGKRFSSILGGGFDLITGAVRNIQKLSFNPFKLGLKGLSSIRGGYNRLEGFLLNKDVYVGQDTTPRLYKRILEEGGYFDERGHVIRSIVDITSDIYDRDGNIVLSVKEAKERGLYDVHRKPIRTLFGKFTNSLLNPIRFGAKVIKGAVTGTLNAVSTVGKAVLNGINPFSGGISIGGNKKKDPYVRLIYELLTWHFGGKPPHHDEEISRIAKEDGTTVSSATRKFKTIKENFTNKINKGKEILNDKLNQIKGVSKSKLEDVESKLNQFKFKEKLQDLKEYPSILKERMDKFKDKTSSRMKRGTGGDYIDPITGEARKGSWREYFKNKKTVNTSSIKPETKDGVKKGIFGSSSKLLVTAIATTVGYIYKKITSLVDWVVTGIKSLKDLGLIKGLTKAVEGVSSLGRAMWNGMSSMASGAMGAASTVWNKTKGVGGKVISSVTSGAARQAVMTGARTAITATTTALASGTAMASTGLATAGAALASIPVLGWVAIGVVAVGIMAYAAYQYFKDDFKELDNFRLLTYGLDYTKYPKEKGKDLANKLLALEREVWDNTTFDKNGKPTVNTDDYHKWVALMWNTDDSGEPTEQQWTAHMEKFDQWWNYRFHPAYCRNAQVAKIMQADLDLTDIDDEMKDGLKGIWVTKAMYAKDNPLKPYDYGLLPFSEADTATSFYPDVEMSAKQIKSKYAEDERDLRDNVERTKTRSKDDSWTDWLTPWGVASRAYNAITGDSEDTFDFEKRLEAKAYQQEAKLTKGGNINTEAVGVVASESVYITLEDGTVKEIEAREANLGNNSLINETEAIRYAMYGLTEPQMTVGRIETLRKLENYLNEKLVFTQKEVSFELIEDDVYKFIALEQGFNPSDVNDKAKWLGWFKWRFLAVYKRYIELARKVVPGIQPNLIVRNLSVSDLYDVMNELKDLKVNPNGKGWVSVWLVNEVPFKGIQLNTDMGTISKWLMNLKEGKDQKLVRTPKSTEEIDIQASKWNEMMSKEMEKWRNKDTDIIQEEDHHTAVLNNPKYQRQVDSTAPDMSGYKGTTIKDTGLRTTTNYSLGHTTPQSPTMLDVKGTGGDVSGIKWKQSAPFKPKNLEHNYEVVKDLIAEVANMVGVDAGIMTRIAYQESGFNGNAKAPTSSATGLYQFINSSWSEMQPKLAKYGVAGRPPTDPVANAIAGALYVKGNIDSIRKTVEASGRQMGATPVYLAHFLGTGGARTFYRELAKNPHRPASEVFPKAASANESIFFNNGRPRSLLDVEQLIGQNKMMRPDQNRKAEEVQRIAKQVVNKASENYLESQQTTTTDTLPENNLSLGAGTSLSQPEVKFDEGSVSPSTTTDSLPNLDEKSSFSQQLSNLPKTESQPTQISNQNTSFGGGQTGGGGAGGEWTTDIRGSNNKSPVNLNTVEGLLHLATDDLVELGKKHCQVGKDVILNGMKPNFMRLFYACIGDYVKSTGTNVVFNVTSAFRTYAQQKALYDKYGAGRAAKPGHSRHESGVAIDVDNHQIKDWKTGPVDKWDSSGILGKWGFIRPLKWKNGKIWEPWHIEHRLIKKSGESTKQMLLKGDSESSNTSNEKPTLSTMTSTQTTSTPNIANNVSQFAMDVSKQTSSLPFDTSRTTTLPDVFGQVSQDSNTSGNDLTLKEGAVQNVNNYQDYRASVQPQMGQLTEISKLLNNSDSILSEQLTVQKGIHSTLVEIRELVVKGQITPQEKRPVGRNISDVNTSSNQQPVTNQSQIRQTGEQYEVPTSLPFKTSK